MKLVFTLLICLLSLQCFGEREERTIAAAEEPEHIKAAAWNFASHPEGGEAGYPYRLEIKQGENDSEPVAVWRSLKPMTLLGYVEAGGYSVAFFADPLIRPSGNVILAWRLVKGKAPELIFATPYSASVGIAYELSNLRVEHGCVCGSITAKLVEGQGGSLTFPIELSEQTQTIAFTPPYDSLN